jgi:hypothetical protein
MPLMSGLPYPLLSPFTSFDSLHLIDKKGALYFLFKAFVWWQPYPLALLILGMMDSSAVRGKLDSLLEALSIWATESAHINAYFINTLGKK